MEKIMIIDSDMGQMRDLNEGLSGDYRILNCSRGSKALELYRLFQPSALILDPATYELDGRDFIRRVRSAAKGHIPILALTRITALKHIENSFDWGVDVIYSKPCTAERVRKKLDGFFTRPEKARTLQPAGV